MNCGCAVATIYQGSVHVDDRIVYCPMHAAAPEMVILTEKVSSLEYQKLDRQWIEYAKNLVRRMAKIIV